ncbi:hypothetical protein [Methanosarcina sp. UBA289]|uniref:hypothetical protein n=1 Tax=Methanosarcina sp. UBA289 TaxID=1915574 RepID=UPI0025CBC7E9|nr:hypothetical protein [Methanosarcina sp. UBA289]
MIFTIQASLPMQNLLAGISRGFVEAQSMLDERARESLIRYQQIGVPPSAFVWSEYRLDFPLALQFQSKYHVSNKTHIMVSPRMESIGNLKLTVRYLPLPEVYSVPD